MLTLMKIISLNLPTINDSCWNVFEQVINEREPDVICLQEAEDLSSNKYELQNYFFIMKLINAITFL